MDQPHLVTPKWHELREKRQQLHGKRRKLHEGLSEACEDFLMMEGLSPTHKRSALVRELEYLVRYYQDEATWEGIE